MTSLGTAVALAAMWVLLWGSASPANVLSGLAIGAILTVLVPGLGRAHRRATLRPRAIARFAGWTFVSTVRSNVELIREVITPGNRVRTAIIGVELPDCSDELLTLITNLLALSPGTMPVEVRHGEPTVLYVHVLHRRDVEETRAEVRQLTELAVRAFGS